MKLNPKVYKQLTGEPFEKQVVDGKNVEFHYMNDTPFLLQYASRGRFAVWTSDGKDYKVLIEKAYYEALQDFYQFGVNKIWLTFLEKVSSMSSKINRLFIIPTIILYVIVAGVAYAFFQDYTLQILLGLIVLVVISNIFQSRIVNNKVKLENKNSQDQIRALIGAEQFDELVKAQEEHYKNYFKFEDEPVEESPIEDTSNKDVLYDENQIDKNEDDHRE
ncbi:MAG: hypothetical protein CVV58_04005 [Tenericutes bacterium HGW-Tenericutes-3]|nr:MAG: hypothetical protein CVV58_04005 [Tenericutes bacterium HGW-Tenericutes-3]